MSKSIQMMPSFRSRFIGPPEFYNQLNYIFLWNNNHISHKFEWDNLNALGLEDDKFLRQRPKAYIYAPKCSFYTLAWSWINLRWTYFIGQTGTSTLYAVWDRGPGAFLCDSRCRYTRRYCSKCSKLAIFSTI